jgi:hypothetical protein
MRNLFTVLFAFLVCNVFGQIAIGASDTPVQSLEIGGGRENPYLSFPEKYGKIDDFLKQNLVFPEEAKRDKKEGYFLVFFSKN